MTIDELLKDAIARPWKVVVHAHDDVRVQNVARPWADVAEFYDYEHTAHLTVRAVNTFEQARAALRACAAHFADTDAPLGADVRAALTAMEKDI